MEVLLIAISVVLMLIALCHVCFGKESTQLLEFKFKNIWLQRVCRICLPVCAVILLMVFIRAPLDSFWANVLLYVIFVMIGIGWLSLTAFVFKVFKTVYGWCKTLKFKESIKNLFLWFWLE